MSYDELALLVDGGMSMRQIAERFGCSQTTIKYWVTKYGLNGRLAYNRPSSDELVCSVCSRGYRYRKRSGHTRSVCNTCVTRRRKLRVKKRLVDHLGGKCVRCGYDEHLAALHFHHEGDKDFGIARNYNRGFEVLLAEVEKCELVCANCHAAIHSLDV